jgi:imidazolonepropionase-like amidohydrolase
VTLEDLGGTELQHLMGAVEHWDAVQPTEIEDAVRTSVARDIQHTPTLVAFVRAAELEHHTDDSQDPMAALMPRYYRELLWNPGANPRVYDLVPGDWATLHQRIGTMKILVRRLHRAQVPILVGTDTPNPFVIPGASLHEELALLVEAGLEPEEALEAATRRAGEALDVPKLGALEVGAPADLLVFREDPTRDLAALATLDAVLAQGRLYQTDDLEQAIAQMSAHLRASPYDAVSTFAARAVLVWINR